MTTMARPTRTRQRVNGPLMAILSDPPTGAFSPTPGQLETWTGDPLAADLRALLLRQVTGRGLRTANHQSQTGTSAWTTPFSSEDTCTS
jgi:hypothetical protein